MLFYAVMLAALFAPLRFRLPIVAGGLSALLIAGTLIPAGADARLVFYTRRVSRGIFFSVSASERSGPAAACPG